MRVVKTYICHLATAVFTTSGCGELVSPRECTGRLVLSMDVKESTAPTAIAGCTRREQSDMVTPSESGRPFGSQARIGPIGLATLLIGQCTNGSTDTEVRPRHMTASTAAARLGIGLMILLIHMSELTRMGGCIALTWIITSPVVHRVI
mgnify:CR=1 FL=1